MSLPVHFPLYLRREDEQDLIQPLSVILDGALKLISVKVDNVGHIPRLRLSDVHAHPGHAPGSEPAGPNRAASGLFRALTDNFINGHVGKSEKSGLLQIPTDVTIQLPSDLPAQNLRSHRLKGLCQTLQVELIGIDGTGNTPGHQPFNAHVKNELDGLNLQNFANPLLLRR